MGDVAGRFTSTEAARRGTKIIGEGKMMLRAKRITVCGSVFVVAHLFDGNHEPPVPGGVLQRVQPGEFFPAGRAVSRDPSL